MVEEKKKGLKAYRGTISSIIMSVVVLGILLIPVITANHIQKVRSGNGKYEFKETMCWTIDEQEDFNGNPDYPASCGSGALGYYHEYTGSGNDFSINQMSYEDNILEGTVDGYGIGVVDRCEYENIDFSMVFIYLTMTKDDIIDLDVTRIDIFFTVSGIEEGCEYDLILSSGGWPGDGLDMGKVTVNELSSIELTVDDMMEIYLFGVGDELSFGFIPVEEEGVVQYNSVVIFDMQMYCIEEIKISSIDWLGISMIGMGFFMMFCSILMLPTIDFGGVAKRLFGKKTVTGGE